MLRRSRRPIAVAVSVLLAATFGLAPASALAANNHDTVGYTAELSPATFDGGTTSVATFTATNVSTREDVAAVSVAVPADLTLAGVGTPTAPDGPWHVTTTVCHSANAPCSAAGQTLILAWSWFSALAPGQALTIPLTLTAPAGPATDTWTSYAAGFGGSNLLVPLVGSAPTSTVLSAAATSLSITGPTSPVVAGTPLTYMVTATTADAHTATGYTGTVSSSSSDTGTSTTLPGAYAYGAADAGTHTFTATLTTAGAQTITVTDGTLTATLPVTILPAQASRLALSGPSSASAGASSALTITAYDSYGNVATGYTGTLDISSTDSGAHTVLPAPVTVTSGTGTAATNVTLTTVGAQGVTATDASSPALTASTTITVTPAQAATLQVSVPPTAVAGTSTPVTITVVDGYGNQVTSDDDTLSLASTDTGTSTVVPTPVMLSGGSATTFITLTTAGAQTLTATDTSTSLAGSAGITVTPASANSLQISAAGTAVAGVATPVTVTALDPYGNVATGYTGTVALTSTDTGASTVLPAPATLTSADAGVLNTSVTLTTAGTQTITATDTSDASLTASTLTDVSAASPAQIVITGAGSPVTAGTSQTLTATIVDGYGNPVVTDGGPLTVTSTDTGSATSLPGPTATSGGAANLPVTLTTAGPQQVIVTDSSTSLSATADITVSPSTATSLVASLPTAMVSGTPASLTVTALDTYGNVATGYVGTVHVTSTDANAAVSLPADYTFMPSDAGSRALPITLATVGAQSVTATDTRAPSLTSTASTIVSAGAPVHIVITGVADTSTTPAAPQPVAGKPFSVTVGFTDAAGNPVPAPASLSGLAIGASGTGIFTPGTVTFSADRTTATFTGDSYSAAQNSVTLTVSSLGATLIPGTDLIDVAAQIAAALAVPNVPLQPLSSISPTTGKPCVLSLKTPTCSELVLPHGASGPVYLSESSCVNVIGLGTLPCLSSGGGTTLLVDGTASLKDANGQPLYSATDPAELIVSCFHKVCVDPPGGDSNHAGEGHAAELAEYVKAYPLDVTVNVNGGTVSGTAAICPTAGVIPAGEYFCLDPTASGFTAHHDFVQVVDFYGDILGHNR